MILGQTNNGKKRIVSTSTQKNSGRDFSLPPLPLKYQSNDPPDEPAGRFFIRMIEMKMS